MRVLLLLLYLMLALYAGPARALDAATVEKLAFGESDEKVAAVRALTAQGDEQALTLLQALADGKIQTADKRVLIVDSDAGVDAVTGEKISPLPEALDDVVVNNRLRGELDAALAALKLVSHDRTVRLAAAKALSSGADAAILPLVHKALEHEGDPAIKPMLEMIAASIEAVSGDKSVRIAAIRTLGLSSAPNTETLLLGLLGKAPDGSYTEPDEDIRFEAQKSVRAVQGRLAWGERAGLLFAGVSLGSILLLAALGLAITYGLMGVINMAHGEFIMIGAYTTYVVQNFFHSHLAAWFGWYLVCAVPASFVVAALVGIALERGVIRFLYGRPLETLLATWGISLFLIQTVRTVFGAQNVEVENPSWMSGGLEILSNVVLPYSRIVIILFAAFVLFLVWAMIARTRIGLFVRAVTQNRPMASCIGVRTPWVDMLAFGLGTGIAGLAGCALSQIGNVGPELGQSLIVDSFMVVVLGGVGQLAGTVYAGLGLGILNKVLEGWSGAVLAKIAILVFIIFFIQKRPQGLFALKSRVTES